MSGAVLVIALLALAAVAFHLGRRRAFAVSAAPARASSCANACSRTPGSVAYGPRVLGKLIEVGETNQIFTNPRHKLTEDYITGRFG